MQDLFSRSNLSKCFTSLMRKVITLSLVLHQQIWIVEWTNAFDAVATLIKTLSAPNSFKSNAAEKLWFCIKLIAFIIYVAMYSVHGWS